MAPPDKDLDWSYEGLEGMYRFLARVWRFVADAAEEAAAGMRRRGRRATPPRKTLHREMHRVIGKVTDDVERFQFNTAHLGADGAHERRQRLPPTRSPQASATSRCMREVAETLDAAAGAVRAAHGRGAVARGARRARLGAPAGVAGVRRLGRRAPTRSSSPCRSTARCAARSSVAADLSEEDVIARRARRGRATGSRARTSRRSSSCRASS